MIEVNTLKEMNKIYESPDGGATVYERDTKTGERICIEKPEYPDWWILDHEWHEITELAQDGNKSIRKILSRLKLLYNISKDSE